MQKIDRCRLYTFEPWLSWIEYERGQHLFEQGGPILGAYLLQRGAIQITQRLLDGHQLLLQFVKNGQWINLSSLTGERWHEYNAHALMPSRVRFIAKDALSAMLKRAPHLATTVHQQIGEALRASREKLAVELNEKLLHSSWS
ncbi:Crp/Fnr family transcriptional regulator [Candidatus Acetothermia bacterium]|nr:Crp/Fnr family transcriptional regulator [Candidatus Acetothermia bacterium]